MSIDIDSPVAKAQTRQEITRCLHETVDRIHNGLRNIPAFVIEALSSRVWEQERVFPRRYAPGSNAVLALCH